MTDTLRTRLTRTALDTADNIATVTAAAATGLTTYRALHTRPTETRITAALATGTLAALLTDQTIYKVLAPLRRRLGVDYRGLAPEAAPAPTPQQLAADLVADAAQRAASGASILDYGCGSLTKTDNWEGMADGSARCEITSTAHLLSVPSPTVHDGYRSRTYLLVQDGEQPVQVHSIGDLVALVGGPANGLPESPGAEDNDPCSVLGEDLAIKEFLPDSRTDGEPADDIDQEAEACADGRP
ncbi:hypothetical protein F7Q99_36765 [Streptomyces kaniharaensis]|uniref:Uncharacterized protein n=1 Tax=Streptomyces kaniharaensis TaxID=212423 RepID=A0A6N7L5F5_9ACTN|nr:hypothetical protein [Streptomyces kaniharaensis]MQS17594.1 hypothetical protein [Streptomyces kaniharaensis]